MKFSSIVAMTAQSIEQPEAVVAKMELHEKLSMLAGKNFWQTVPIDRLEIPSLKVSDGPNGARGDGFLDGVTAACFPAGVSLASTFNRSLAQQVGSALGDETLTKGANVLLGPTACIQRSPLGGRNFETYSEDPFLSGIVAANYVKGLQSKDVGATLKHFVANEQETGRLVVDETISERAMREIYLKPFEMVVKEANPWCVMASYPKVNGHHMDAQSTYIQDVLRNEWHFDGLVMSDWGGTTNGSLSVKNGLDLEMPGPARRRTPAAIEQALNDGLVTIQDIDNRVLALLKLLERTRKFSDRRETPAEQAIDRPEHRALIRKAGAEGIVLLKNEGSLLPLDLNKTRKIALIGPLVKEAAVHGGGSASVNCHYKITPWDAFQQRLAGQVELSHAKGAHVHRNLPDLEQGTKTNNGTDGLTALYFKSANCSGEAFYTEELKRGLFTNMMKEGGQGAKSVRVSTTYTPPESGKHYVSFSGVGPSKLFIDGELVSSQQGGLKDPLLFILGLQPEQEFQFAFDASKSYEIVVETGPAPKTGNGEAGIFDDQISAHIGLMLQSEMEQDLLGDAVNAATSADLAIVFVGNTPKWESEGVDMATMALPARGSQDRLITAVAKANPNTIVVNLTGVPVETPWLGNITALLQAWFAGQESGNAILDVLLGEVSPSGKLPVSWPKRIEDTPSYGNFGRDSEESQKVEYKEGVNVGYRHYDRKYGSEGEVQFPFGYGLSYTTFAVSDAKLTGTLSAGCNIEIEVTVTNSGAVAGAETVQIYLAPPAGSDKGRPPKTLIGFEKAFLQPGESKTVTVTAGQDAASFWDEEGHSWAVESGRHTILVATSSHPQDVRAELHVDIADAYTYSPIH